MFGPTRGDRLRLGDTSLWIEIERDLVEEKGGLGDELKFGGGKTVREGMGQATGRSDKETLDMIITNAVIVDWNGIYKVSFSFSSVFVFSVRIISARSSGSQMSNASPSIGAGQRYPPRMFITPPFSTSPSKKRTPSSFSHSKLTFFSLFYFPRLLSNSG